jgi:hypothetical protein
MQTLTIKNQLLIWADIIEEGEDPTRHLIALLRAAVRQIEELEEERRIEETAEDAPD